MRRPRSILITGASSGLGAALARAYAAPDVALALGGRDAGRLEAVAASCADLGATVATRAVDVTDRDAMPAWLAAADSARPLDLVVANAGIDGTAVPPEKRDRAIFRVNLDGMLNTVAPAVAAMRPRGRGQIAIVSSLAAFRGMPGAAAYSASKAAVRCYAEALRGRLAADGIAVSAVCPGFVRTPMTDGNRFPMPFLMEPERAAAIVVAGLARDRGRIAFPWPLYAGAWLLATLPDGLAWRLTRRLPHKV